MVRVRDRFSGELIEAIVEMLGLDKEELDRLVLEKFQESRAEREASEADMNKLEEIK